MFSRLRTMSVKRVAIVIAVLAGALLAFPQVASAIVTEEVRNDLPIALDGEVWAVEQVGNFVFVGGNFTQVQVSRDGPIVDQATLFAYDIDTGVFVDSFRPEFGRADGVPEVRAIQPAPDGSGLYVGGNFGTINDGTDGVARVRNRIALLDGLTGRLDRNFSNGGVNAQVNSLALDNFGRLYVGGNFTVGLDLAPDRPPIEQSVRGLARFDGTSAAFDTGFRYESRQDIGRIVDGERTFGVSRIAFTPDGSHLFVAHRGEELRDVTRGEVLDSPGLARIEIGANFHRARQYRALFPLSLIHI